MDSEAATGEVGKLESGMREVRVRLEQRRNDNNVQRSQSAIMEALMAAKALGSIAGIHGRLGESFPAVLSIFGVDNDDQACRLETEEHGKTSLWAERSDAMTRLAQRHLYSAGDLGAIDKKYDVAVSTACGALDNVVVSDAVAAQRCVELVRKEKLGVVTCLMLDKQRQLVNSAAEKVTPPEGRPRSQGSDHANCIAGPAMDPPTR